MALQRPEVVREENIFPGETGINTWGKGMVKRVFRYPGRGEPDDFYLWHSEKVAAIVLPLTTNQEIIAVRVFSQAANDFILQLPGGVPRRGESLSDAASRELREETGHETKLLEMLGIGWFEPFNLTTPFHPYLATGCEKSGDLNLDSTERLEVETYPLKTWWTMCMDGTIVDAKSVLVTARGLHRAGLLDPTGYWEYNGSYSVILTETGVEKLHLGSVSFPDTVSVRENAVYVPDGQIKQVMGGIQFYSQGEPFAMGYQSIKEIRDGQSNLLWQNRDYV